LQIIMRGVPSTRFVSFVQAILFRGAGLALICRDYLAIVGLGALFFVLSAQRFQSSARYRRHKLHRGTPLAVVV